MFRERQQCASLNASDQERMLTDVRQADRQVKAGHYIRHEDTKAWLLSWARATNRLRRGASAEGVTMLILANDQRRKDQRPK
jgi:hypothetical protein